MNNASKIKDVSKKHLEISHILAFWLRNIQLKHLQIKSSIISTAYGQPGPPNFPGRLGLPLH